MTFYINPWGRQVELPDPAPAVQQETRQPTTARPAESYVNPWGRKLKLPATPAPPTTRAQQEATTPTTGMVRARIGTTPGEGWQMVPEAIFNKTRLAASRRGITTTTIQEN